MKTVCFGDSLTSCGMANGRYSDIVQDRFPKHVFVNRGVGGESFVEGKVRLETDVLQERPDVVLVEFDANDWWRKEREPAAWAADLDATVAAIQAQGARAVVLGVFGEYLSDDGKRVPKVYGIDERGVAYRQLEEQVARKHGCPYVANIQERIVGRRCCWRDRNHPNEYGNRHVADAVEPVIEALTGDKALPVRKPTLQTTRDMWQEAVALAPTRLAAVDGDRRVTFAEAEDAIARIAAHLVRVSGVPRPKVAVYLPNCLEYFLLYWAVARLGGVIVPLNTWLRKDGLAGICRNVRPEVLVVRSAADTLPLEAAAEAPPKARVALDAGNSGLLPWDALLRPIAAPDLAPIAPDAVSIVMHTSGTTATPKGAMMRHSDLMFNVMAAIAAHQFNERDVNLLVNPMFHCTALYSSLPTAAYTKTPVIIANATDPAHLMDLVQHERITTFLSIPSVFHQILKVKDLDAYDKSSLRVIAYAGSAMPVSAIRKLQQHFPEVELHNFFGLTETISMTHVLNGKDAEQRPDSIGRLLPFVEAKIVDDNDADLPAGKVGELLFARENVIPGYYGDPGKLEQSLVALGGRPWFRTGDLAMVDEEGYFFIRGRKKDMIIVGGENVYAAEVEAFLMTHDLVDEAAVRGVPATGAAAFLGEQIEAYVVRSDPALTEQALRRYCFEHMAAYKVPRRVIFVERLPRNPSGKVVKDDLPACSLTERPGNTSDSR